VRLEWSTPLRGHFWFHEEPHDLLFNMRPSIPVSQDASEQVRVLHEVRALIRSVLQQHKDEMQARSEPSTTLHFVRGDKVTSFTKNLLLRIT
jgi:hypothetical protein